MAAGTSPTASLPLEVAEACREIFLQSNAGDLIRAPVFVEEFSATVRNMLAHKTVFENYLGGQFIVEGKQCFSARDRTRCIAEIIEDQPSRAVIKLPESSLNAVTQVLDYCQLVHTGAHSEANLATKAKQLAASSTQVQLYELATTAYCLDVKALVQVSTQEISKRMTDAFKNPAFLSKALKSSGLSANAINRLDMNARSLKKKSELAAKLVPKEIADSKADNSAAQAKAAQEEKAGAVSEAEKLRRKRRKEKQKERKKLLKLQSEGDSQTSSADNSPAQSDVSKEASVGQIFVQRFSDGTIALASEEDLANMADNADDSDVESDHEDFDNEIEEFRRRLESFGPVEPVAARARIPTATAGLGLNS